MRTLFPVFLLTAQTLAAANFPPAITPERPVSERVFIAAAGNQQTLAIASDGNLGFAVWLDARRGSSDLLGSRIDSNGTLGAAVDPQALIVAQWP
jgi:hypothetical protein